MDATHLRQRAAELRAAAEHTRQAAVTAATTDDVEWRSLAAERFREALWREADLTRRCADLLDDAARAMAAHALAVDGRAVVPAIPAPANPAVPARGPR